MTLYEIKKVFSRTGSKIAVLVLLVLLSVVSYFAVHGVGYVNEQGETEYGISAVKKLRAVQREWSGDLTVERLQKVMEENVRIRETEEYKSPNVQKNNIAYGWKQGFMDINSLIIAAFGAFRDYDYTVLDSLSPEQMEMFYENRVLHLKEWLDTEGKDQFSEKEKAFLVSQYQETEIPLHYSYMKGWEKLFEYAPSIFMIMVLTLGFLVSGIFSSESQLRADSILYTSYHGRGKAVTAKIKAGFCIITAIYWSVTLLYTGIVLGILGADGAGNMIQTSMGGRKSFYNITFFQEYLLLVLGGYVGSLFILFLTMLVSAKTKSTVLAVVVPFILIFLPSFMGNLNLSMVNKLLGLMPDQLLQMNMAVRYFNLYQVGEKIMGAAGILLVLYSVLAALLMPLMYFTIKKAEVV